MISYKSNTNRKTNWIYTLDINEILKKKKKIISANSTTHFINYSSAVNAFFSLLFFSFSPLPPSFLIATFHFYTSFVAVEREKKCIKTHKFIKKYQTFYILHFLFSYDNCTFYLLRILSVYYILLLLFALLFVCLLLLQCNYYVALISHIRRFLLVFISLNVYTSFQFGWKETVRKEERHQSEQEWMRQTVKNIIWFLSSFFFSIRYKPFHWMRVFRE